MYNQIIQTIGKIFSGTTAVYCFGSFGTEYELPESDVDIALLFPAGFKTEKEKMDLCRYELENLLKREVDLIDLRKVNTVFQWEIISTGRCIYNCNSAETDNFEMLVMSNYQKLNEERKDIILDIYRTGKVLSA